MTVTTMRALITALKPSWQQQQDKHPTVHPSPPRNPRPQAHNTMTMSQTWPYLTGASRQIARQLALLVMRGAGLPHRHSPRAQKLNFLAGTLGVCCLVGTRLPGHLNLVPAAVNGMRQPSCVEGFAAGGMARE